LSSCNQLQDPPSLTMISSILYILYLRYIGLEKLADADLNELFVPLSTAATRGGEAVSIPELKIAVVKALRALIDKLDTKKVSGNEDSIVQDKACAD
jgi:hypothetical protein